MTPQPTGHPVRLDEGDAVLFTRTFATTPDDLWAAITEPARLARWIGTWTGDPADGHVAFSMTAEGDDGSAPMRYDIERCEPPHALTVASTTDFGTWRLVLRVRPTDAGAALDFHHVIDDPAGLADIGPGWEYYLDRLVAAETGGDPDAIDWADYHPAQCAYYGDLAPGGTA